MKNLIFTAFLLLACICTSKGQTGLIELNLRTVTSNIQVPWEIRWGFDNWIWATGINGKIIKVNPQTGEQKTLFEGIQGLERTGESGMHGFDFVKDDADQLFVYVAYTYRRENNSIALRVIRLRYNSALDVLENPQTVIENIGAGSTHSGCRIKKLQDNTLLITAGDGRIQPNPAQNINHWSGKTLRINPDGTFPTDNPFPNSPVWSWGHRNHQGLCVSETGKIYSSEHGEQAEDEVNILNKSRNYGWPTVEGYCNLPQEQKFCADSNVKIPIANFSPTIGIAGMEYYNFNSDFIDWKKSLILTSLKGSSIHILNLSENGDSVVKKININLGLGRLRSICVSPEGRIFIGRSQGDHYGSRDNKDNAVVEITSKLSDSDDVYENTNDNLEVDYNVHNNTFNVQTLSNFVWGGIMYDLSGSVIINLGQNTGSKSFDTKPYNKGVYILKFEVNNNNFCKKILIY